MTPVELMLTRLPGAKRNGRSWQARCPRHDDKRPSLSIGEGRDGRVLLRCHAGCSNEAIVAALGLTLRDLMPVSSAASQQQTTPNTRAARVYNTAREAVAELERRHGPRSALWTYTDANGQPVGIVVRWDAPGAKDIRPVSRTPKGWVIGAMSAPRPLYRLPELHNAQQVYIVEGEKCADALGQLDLVATTSAGGSNAARFTDWTPLAGKNVVVIPDNDAPGQKYARDVLGLLSKLAPPPTVRLVELPGLPAGGDVVDFVDWRDSQTTEEIWAEIETLVAAAPVVDFAVTECVPRGEPYRPFPADALPEPIRSFVAKGAHAIGCDASYIALPLLSALAAAIGNTRRIQLKRGWTEPAILWTAIVGESGTLKTPAFKLVMLPIRDRQARKLKEHQAAFEQYERDLLRYEAELAGWRREAAKSKGTAGDPPEKPQPPQAERYIVSDTTVEALAPILLANPRGVLLARDELAAWIRSFDAYKAGRGGDAQSWLSAHVGESIVVDRKASGTIYVPSACVSIAGGIQPRILDRALAAEHRDDGLLARLLLAMPPRQAKRWTEVTIPEEVEAKVAAIIRALYELQPEYDDGDDPRPRVLRLTSGGKAAWVGFYNEHGREQADLTGDLSAAWSKLEGYAARLALVVQCVRTAAGEPTLGDPEAVDETSIAAGVTLSQWFGHEARRVYGILGEDDQARERRRLVELIQRKGGRTTARELQQSTRQFRDSGESAEHALNELVDAGTGRWEQPSPDPKGGRPTRIFVLSTPSTVYETLRNPEKNVGSVDVDTVDRPTSPGRTGCPDGEPPPEDVRFASCPEAAGAADEWGEL